MSLGGKGIRDWVVQRATAVYLAGYIFFLIYFWLTHTDWSATQWQEMFSSLTVRVSTLLALFALLVHSWIGVWTIITDYVHAYCIRVALLSIVAFCLLGYLSWGLCILWG